MYIRGDEKMILNAELFVKIAEALISEYARVYSINLSTNEYRRYLINENTELSDKGQHGSDFFRDLLDYVVPVVHEPDKYIFQDGNLKETLLQQLQGEEHHSFAYRVMTDGQPVYHIMRLIHEYTDENNDRYLIIGVRNVDKEVQYQIDIDKKVYMDLLTGALNKNAYQKLEEEYQIRIENDTDLCFGLIVCDVNNLKIINDTMGHKAGDELLQSVSALLQNAFSHSHVYRVGGDEFVVFLKDLDYKNRIELYGGLRQTIIDNQNNGDGPVVAMGMSIYMNGTDKNISDVFKRADELMYDDKKTLKMNVARNTIKYSGNENIKKIPAIRKSRLDSFFKVFKMASGKGNIFFCDIRYDLSRWDKQIVDNYNLPSEYMYNAGGIWEQRIHPSDRNIYKEKVDTAFDGGKDEFELSYRVKDSSGKYVPCTCKGLVIRNQHGEPEYFGGALFISESEVKRVIPEDRKRKLDSMFEALSIISDDSNVFLCDLHYDYSRWSKGLVEEFGMPSEYMYDVADIWMEHVHPEDRQRYSSTMDDIFHFKTMGLDIQYRARKADGQYNVCSGLGILIKDENGHPEYLGGRIRNHAHYSYTDVLTGLRNQYGFFEDVLNNIRNEKEVRITVIGISKLAEINAVHGYGTGNNVLQHFGRYLVEHIGHRSNIYRLDGPKFAVITDKYSFEDVKKSYNMIRKYFREGIDIDETFITAELNASTLVLNEYDTDSQTVYACLNFAYNESKNDKQGKLVEFKNDLRNEERLRIAKLHVIRNSITKGYKGFYLVYQPVVDANTEELIGAEALLRWKNDVYGIVPPDVFIPILEVDPLFPDLGEWILITALEAAKEILIKKPDFVINVNLSYVQVAQPDFLEKVWNALKVTDFPAEHLCLEITERCRLLDVNLLKNVISALRAGGVRIALDDFGTGYSSLGLMKNLPLDTIKIDRTFVQKIEADDKEQRLVENLTEFAKIFETKVCVEGIETSGMRDILRKYGINSFQGYYYSKPIEKEELYSKYC